MSERVLLLPGMNPFTHRFFHLLFDSQVKIANPAGRP
jgi:hypothetical protein